MAFFFQVIKKLCVLKVLPVKLGTFFFDINIVCADCVAFARVSVLANVQYVMEEMFFSGSPLLEAVGLHEPFVEQLRDTIRHCISKATIPMRTYAEQYESFLPILILDPSVYIRFLFAAFNCIFIVHQDKILCIYTLNVS